MPPKGRSSATRAQLIFCPRESARASFNSCSMK
jgi:hypothetical protein